MIEIAIAPTMIVTCSTTRRPYGLPIWTTGETHDISLKMFLILAAGTALWVVYGVLKGDGVIILANGLSLAFLCAILFFKLRNMALERG